MIPYPRCGAIGVGFNSAVDGAGDTCCCCWPPPIALLHIRYSNMSYKSSQVSLLPTSLGYFVMKDLALHNRLESFCKHHRIDQVAVTGCTLVLQLLDQQNPRTRSLSMHRCVVNRHTISRVHTHWSIIPWLHFAWVVYPQHDIAWNTE